MNTVKKLFEASLVLLDKTRASDMHLRDFNIIINDVIDTVVAEIHIAFEQSQISLDLLKGLKQSQAFTTFTPSSAYDNAVQVALPADYRHLTALRYRFEVNNPSDCILMDGYRDQDTFEQGSRAINDNEFAAIQSNPHFRARYFQPFHSIIGNTLHMLTGNLTGSGLSIQRATLNYLKVPERVNLSYSQAFSEGPDTSQILEFDEIMNRRILDKYVLRMKVHMKQPDAQSYQAVTTPMPTAELGGLGTQPPQQ